MYLHHFLENSSQIFPILDCLLLGTCLFLYFLKHTLQLFPEKHFDSLQVSFFYCHT